MLPAIFPVATQLHNTGQHSVTAQQSVTGRRTTIARTFLGFALFAIAIGLMSPSDCCSTARAEQQSAKATTPTTVAGATLEQMIERAQQSVEPENKSARVAKLRAVKSLGAFGQAATPALRQLLDDPDAGARYTAAVSLGRIGGKELNQAKSQLETMLKNDSSAAVQMACAYAVIRAGGASIGLPVLIERVQSNDRATTTSAAELLGKLGATAQPAESVLVEVAQRHRPGGPGDYHMGAAAANALREIRRASETAAR